MLSSEKVAHLRNVSLMKHVEGRRKSDDVDDGGLRKCTFKVQIEAAVEACAYQAPGFRFRFLDGSRKQTSAIGSGHGWTPARDNDSALLVPFRFEQSFPDIEISESFAMAIDEDPILSFIQFDDPVLAATGASPRTQGKEGKPSTIKSSSQPAVTQVMNTALEFTPRAFVEMYEIDVSSLLSGALQIKQVWTKSLDGVIPQKNDGCGSTLFKHEAFSSLYCINPTSGLQYFSVQISIDQPLLTGELLKKLNPITFTIGAGRRLPGVTIQGVGMTSPHSPLQRYCKPAFAMIHFYPDRLDFPFEVAADPSGPRKHLPRLLLTPGQRQAETIRWNSSLTLLCARYNTAELADAIRYGTLTVEIHDRDLKQNDMVSRLQLKWESLYTRGIDPEHQLLNISTTSPTSTNSSNADHAGISTTPNAKQVELSAVDDIAQSDYRMLIANSSRLFPYGLATFRLVELLNTAKQRISGMLVNNGDEPYMTLKLTTDIIAMKRRASPLDTEMLCKLSELPIANDRLEKAVREPGSYVTCDATLSISIVLQSPIGIGATEVPAMLNSCRNITLDDNDKLSTALKFARMVVIIPYKDNVTLGEVAKAMTTINLKALPGVSISSYQMTEAEKIDCQNGILDVITGTQIIDSQFRMIIVEGLADKGMMYLATQIHRKGPNESHGYRMLCNNELSFPRRLYTVFEIDVKRIKLRCPLSALMTMPDIYMRVKVSESCHHALTRLSDMRKVERLVQAKELDLFPTAQMLLEVESKHGEGITLEDIYGTNTVNSNEFSISEAAIAKKLALACKQTKIGDYRTNRLKIPTDSINASYEQSRRCRIEKNFLLERKNYADFLQSEYATEKRRAEMLQDNSQGPIYLYSGQKLRTQDLLQEEQRVLLSKDRSSTYTYSSNFQSLALSLVDLEALRQSNGQEDRREWTTQRGFIYPAPRRPSEYNKHPNALSEARCEDLRQPFVDNVNNPKPVTRNSSEAGRHKRLEFSTLPSRDMIFGGTNGDGACNSDYFRSVHLCGDGLRREMDEARRKEQEEWERRLVVDKKQLKFLAHGATCSQPRKKPSQLDKIADILKSPASSKPIQIVRNATLPSGKRVPLEKSPVTIFDQEIYALRPFDSKHLVTTNFTSNKPKIFSISLASNILTPPTKKMVSRKKIMQLLDIEKKGLVWRNED